MDEAALDFALNYNVISIQYNVEYASSIICVNDEDGNVGYTYSIPIKGTKDKSKPQLHFSGHKVAATVHSHARYFDNDGLNTADYFSGQAYYREEKG